MGDVASILGAVAAFEPMQRLYVRDDGAHAIVVSIKRGTVFFRRHEDGELLQVSTAAFARRYRAADEVTP